MARGGVRVRSGGPGGAVAAARLPGRWVQSALKPLGASAGPPASPHRAPAARGPGTPSLGRQDPGESPTPAGVATATRRRAASAARRGGAPRRSRESSASASGGRGPWGPTGRGFRPRRGPCLLLVAPASSAAAALRLGSIPRTDHFCRLHCHQPGPGHHLELRSPSSALGRGLPASS